MDLFDTNVIVTGISPSPCLIRMIEGLGCSVKESDSQIILRHTPIDIVFVEDDGGDCREIISRIRSREREEAARGFDPTHIPIVVHGVKDMKALEYGADDVIVGELTQELLAQCVETWRPETMHDLERYQTWLVEKQRSEELLTL